jgi:alpha-beta hydrolase superfamily lysophospholipase
MVSHTKAFGLSMRPLFLWLALVGCNGPEWGANALLHPARVASHGIPDGSESFEVDVGSGIALKGWWAKGAIPRRGLVLWLHGVGDNKDSAEGLIDRWTKKGFDVAAYDSRAHGGSGGKICTYGFFEKHDVSRVLDALQKAGAAADRTILVGFSMGGAVALQAVEAGEPRVIAVAALAPFASLRSAASHAAPFWMSKRSIESALARADQLAQFSVDEVAPAAHADQIHVPLLLVHGTHDPKIAAADSQQILGAGGANRRLVLVDGADHDHLLDRKETWAALDQFLDGVAPPDGRR